VANRHRFTSTTYRVDPELRRRARVAVEQVGSDMNGHVVAFLRWLVGDTDELPPRPPERVPDDPGR
jgi:hypothetical protein